MNQLRKWLGLIWMLMGPLSMFYLIKTALHQVAVHPVTDTKIQWAVFVVIFIPIAIGLCIFGWYAWKGEYKRQM
ncbi:DUF6814 family protein [Agriterribacter sp.]|uniref:DUF6814 family protein n=1 Tax=Agriterribacter sp. TaxID=2821509 RepID=UPI002C56445B|nr:hypothetical protein [Agriterribacter sp.]HRP58146.1 hypothetical protein [Agriterribacter sp.]